MARSRGHQLLLADAVDALEAVSGGVTNGVEPAAASGAVHPALGEIAFGVGAKEHVVRPLLVGERERVIGIRDVCLATVMELGLFPRPTPRTLDELHCVPAFRSFSA